MKTAKSNKAFEMKFVQRGARLRRTPFFDATQKYGARGYTVYNHIFFPINFDSFEAEYDVLTNGVTIWDVSVERQVEITGRDAFKFTNMLVGRDLNQCKVGQGKYVVLTDEQGGIINDPVLLRLGENHFWLALADSDVLLWAKGAALNMNLDVQIIEPDVSPIQIQGPNSKPLMKTLFGNKVLELPYYFFTETKLNGIPLIVTRTGWSAEVGYEIYLRDGKRGEELWERIMKAGKKFHIKPTGPSDIRRIEAGILNYGADMTLENNPYEVGLGWLIDSNKKEDFIGKKALQQIKANGVKQKLVGVEIAGNKIEFNMNKWKVSVKGNNIGQITSAIYSPRLKKNIGYAMVPVEYAALGTSLTVTLPDSEKRKAIVVHKPFIDPKKDIPKS